MFNSISKLTYFLLIVVTVIFLGCLDEIDFDVPAENQDSLVIQGRLVKGDPHTITVEVKRLFDFTGGSSFIRVNYVRITNEQGQSIDLENLSLGIYESTVPVDDPDFDIQYLGQYKVTVQTLDDRLYESSFETLYPVSRIDDINYTIVQREWPTANGLELRDRLLFLLNTPLTIPGSEEKARINWQVQRTYALTDQPLVNNIDPKTCYITENVNIEEVKPFDGNILTQDYLEDYELYETNLTYHFREGFYLNVYQQSLSRGAYQYWDQIDKLLQRNGNMFESPVGEIVSNLKNVNTPDEDIFGYFYATEIDTMHVWVEPSQVVSDTTNYCPPPLPPPPGGGCPVEVCCDCLAAPISTTTQPAYWQ